MSQPTIRDRIAGYIQKNPTASYRTIATALNLNLGGRECALIKTIKAAAFSGQPIPAEPSEQREFNGDTGVIATRRPNVRTLDELLEYMEVDLGVWEVDKHVINKWEVGAKDDEKQVKVTPLYQVKAWLKRKTPAIREIAFETIIARLNKTSPAIRTKRPEKSADPCIVELALYDAHFSLLAWEKETGNNYDLKTASESYLASLRDLLAKTESFHPERILLPIGNDLFHVNNPEGVTPASHNILDVDGRLGKIIETVQTVLIRAVQDCLRRAPVEVIWIPGNHDPQTSYFMCRILAAYFRNTPGVTVDVTPPPRKYRRYGSTLIGFTHGNEENHRDLPTIMAAERRDDWAKAKHYEWHTGHFHKKRETRFSAADTFGNVVVRVIPSISGTDAWHFKKGYVQGERTAEAFVFGKHSGLIGQFTSRNLRQT